MAHGDFGGFIIDHCSPLFPSASSATATATTKRAKAKSNQNQQVKEECLKANTVLTELSDGLKESIGSIVRTSADKLMAFRFPPIVASGLQVFMDYC